MKNALFLYFIFGVYNLFGQDEPEQFVIVNRMPIHKECRTSDDELRCTKEKLIDFIKEHTVYPQGISTSKYSGYVEVRFIIGKNGSVEENKTKVVSGFTGEGSAAFNQEAIRVINSIPPLIPGEKEGEKIRVEYTLPVYFE